MSRKNGKNRVGVELECLEGRVVLSTYTNYGDQVSTVVQTQGPLGHFNGERGDLTARMGGDYVNYGAAVQFQLTTYYR